MQYEVIHSAREIRKFMAAQDARWGDVGSVYALEMPNGSYKIGYTKNPLDRYKTLMSKGYMNMRPTGKEIITEPCSGPGRLEFHFHLLFKQARIGKTECFKVTEFEIRRAFSEVREKERSRHLITDEEKCMEIVSSFSQRDIENGEAAKTLLKRVENAEAQKHIFYYIATLITSKFQ